MTAETGSAGKAIGFMVAAGAVLAVGIGLAWSLWPQRQPPSTPDPVAATPAPEVDTPQMDAAPVEDGSPAMTGDTAQAPEADVPPGDAAPDAMAASGFDVVRVDRDGSAVVAGHAEPGSTIQLTLDGKPLENVDVGSDGNFVALLDLPVETPGALGIAALDDSGNVIENGQSPQTVLIAPTRVDAVTEPEAEAPAGGDAVASASSAVTPDATPATEDDMETVADAADATAPQVLLADDQGIAVLQDGTGRPAVDNIVIDAITYDETGDVALSGRGQSGANLRVYLDNSPIEIGEVLDSGQWRVPLPQIDSGVYTLRVDELADDGTVTSRTETPFKREEPAQLAAVATQDPQAPKTRVEAVTVQPGSTLWAIAREHLGEGPLYVRVFAANREQIRDPDLIYPGQVFTIPEAQ